MEEMSYSLDFVPELREKYFTGRLHLMYSGISKCWPGHFWGARRPVFMIHMILKGKGRLVKSSQSWSMGEGDAFGLFPDETYMYVADRKDPWTYCWIGFQGTEGEKIMRKIGFSREKPVIHLPDLSSYEGKIKKLYQYRSFSYEDELHRTGMTAMILADLVEDHKKNPDYMEPDAGGKTADQAENYVTETKRYISGHYGEDLTIDSIAKYLGVSHSHLSHVFKKMEDISVQQYLTSVRLQSAASTLTTNLDLSVHETARRCGYKDDVTFSKAFRKCYGVSPREYRKLYEKRQGATCLNLQNQMEKNSSNPGQESPNHPQDQGTE